MLWGDLNLQKKLCFRGKALDEASVCASIRSLPRYVTFVKSVNISMLQYNEVTCLLIALQIIRYYVSATQIFHYNSPPIVRNAN